MPDNVFKIDIGSEVPNEMKRHMTRGGGDSCNFRYTMWEPKSDNMGEKLRGRVCGGVSTPIGGEMGIFRECNWKGSGC